MKAFYLAGKNYILYDDGRVMASRPHRRTPSIDPQLALRNARLVFDRTLVDAQLGGYAMAKFITEQHLKGSYIGAHRHYNLSRHALKRLQTIVASW